ncbi:LOW QUALITY PROTEIN: hypothetical protein U9M48_002986 [Paspalum notatum var. saurae]|uniref:Uncharacterized protein n=1 Tax=Paspalum notatum var. saurae TaxID=547442 RepID=A0AAQ3SJJ4_PASNO
MYQDLKQKFWWYNMKRDVAEYVALCDICQRVKAEHQKPAGLLQPLKIQEWKWEEIGTDFIVSLLRTQNGFDSIWVVRLHESMDTKLNFSSAYHPQTDGQTERTNQILEDIMKSVGIKVCRMLNFLTTTVIGLVSECRIFKLCTVDDAERRYIEISPQIFGPEIIEDAERQVQMVKENLRISQTRQKSHADHRHRDLEFAVGDYVNLKVSPIRGLRRFKVKGKLAPQYIGPFKIIDRRGEVAYQLELPDRLSGVHDVFHISQLKKCLRVPEEQLQMDDLNVQDDLTYTEYPKRLPRKEKMILEEITRNFLLANPKISGRYFFKGHSSSRSPTAPT